MYLLQLIHVTERMKQRVLYVIKKLHPLSFTLLCDTIVA
jgi:hypothetical protein